MNKNDMKVALLVVMLLSASLISGCGCSKPKDPESQQVMGITITPAATPTPAPEEIDPAAVVTNGSITMVNEYLAEDAPASEDTSSSGEASASGDTNE